MALIECVGLRREYEMISETVVALDDVDLTIEKGELVMLLGPSGSGKTTLLNIISALDSPDAGEYRFDGAPVPASKSEAMTTFRRENVGYIFQFFNLLGDLTVLENVMLVQEISGKLSLSPKTVNSYRYRVFDKLAVRNDVGLTRLAIKHGIIDAEAA